MSKRNTTQDTMNKFTSETLKCPGCGTGIEEWFYVEHVVAYRRVQRARRGGPSLKTKSKRGLTWVCLRERIKRC